MEGILIIMLSVVGSSICYPTSEQPIEVKMLTSENLTTIAEILNEQNLEGIQEGDTKHLLDIVSMLKKKHKTPLAIILTRADLNEDEDFKSVNAIQRDESEKENINTDNQIKVANRGLNVTAEEIFPTENLLNLPVNTENGSVQIKENIQSHKEDVILFVKGDNELDLDLTHDNEDVIENIETDKEKIGNATIIEPKNATTSSKEFASNSDVLIEDAAVNKSINQEKKLDLNTGDENVDENLLLDLDKIYSKLLETDTNDTVKKNSVQSVEPGIELDYKDDSHSNNTDLINILRIQSDRDNTIRDKDNSEAIKPNSNQDFSETIIARIEDSPENTETFSEGLKCDLLKSGHNNEYSYIVSDSVDNFNTEYSKDKDSNGKRSKMDSITYNLSFIFNK